MFLPKNMPIHFIGIGGIGMSGIAEVLLQIGCRVSGSDLRMNRQCQKLINLGAKIYCGHDALAIEKLQPQVVVYSSAIAKNNPEVIWATTHSVPLIQRAEMLAELMRLKKGLAVAGTHGKTTTTSLLATILHGCDLDPTHIIGGVVDNLGGHAALGKSEILVVEADESDGSFLLLGPIMSVITNIDTDHLEHYGDIHQLKKAFIEFANRVPFYGRVALNIDDPNVEKIREEISRPALTFSTQSQADYLAKNIVYQDGKALFDLYFQGQWVQKYELPLLGLHNISNCLGAIALAHQVGAPFSKISQALSQFKGVGRRFQTLLKHPKGLEVIDDYGHHPTEVEKTLVMAKDILKKPLIVVFEPHRYSRTQRLWSQFLHCFNNADHVYITPIYPASERPIGGVTGERLVQDINQLHPNLSSYLEDLNYLHLILDKYWDQDVTLLTLGAGTIGKAIRKELEKRATPSESVYVH